MGGRAQAARSEGLSWPGGLRGWRWPVDCHRVGPGLTSVNYSADAGGWYVRMEIRGLWRVMFLVNEDTSDDRVQTREFAQSVWTQVNLVNLHENILPTRGRAHLVLEKGRDHAINRVRLRKL